MRRQTTSSLTGDLGHTGLYESYGVINDDFLREWKGGEKVKRVDEMMRNSPIIGALRLAIEMPIRNIEWTFESDDGEDDPRLELMEASIDNMTHSWHDHLLEALLMPFFGWSMFTITYEAVNGQMLWRKFKMLGHDTVERWLLAEDGGIMGLQQNRHLWPTPIPIERMILYRLRKTRNSPEGESILRPSWIPWYYIKNIQHVEAIGIERNLAGLPIITPPMGADMSDGGTDRTQAELIVRNVRQDEQAGVVLPAPTGEGDHNRWHFDLLSANGTGKAGDTDMIVSRYEKRMLMSALAQFLILGQDNVGALATFQGASDFFTMAINSIADVVSETFSKYAIPRLLRLNGLNDEGIRIEHSPAGNVDLAMVGTFLQQMGAMITWTPDDEAWLRAVAKLPPKTVEELTDIRVADQERRAANARAMQEGMRQAAQNREAGQGEVDENETVYFVSGKHPQDDEIQDLEERWYNKAAKFFRGQQRRIMNEVK